ncbi:MAG: hypothetical protein JWO59_1960, partial [Chloroflexi bacterium]|nr:hypothetical protein [Chloroflexota bacterium]
AGPGHCFRWQCPGPCDLREDRGAPQLSAAHRRFQHLGWPALAARQDQPLSIPVQSTAGAQPPRISRGMRPRWSLTQTLTTLPSARRIGRSRLDSRGFTIFATGIILLLRFGGLRRQQRERADRFRWELAGSCDRHTSAGCNGSHHRALRKGASMGRSCFPWGSSSALHG